MKKKVHISYIIPCYNVQDYLPRCLKSLQAQSLGEDLDVEFILVDDGSTDNTLSILREFERNENKAHVITQKNQGVSSARNIGLKVAKGKYVFFLDSDDWLTDEASRVIFEASHDGNPDIIVANAYIFNENDLKTSKEWNPCSGIESGTYGIMEFARKVYRLPISFKAYRRELLLSNGILFNESLRVGEVYAFFVNAMTYSCTISYTDKRVMCYLVRGSSVMRTDDIERDSTIIRTMHCVDEYARKRFLELRWSPSYKRSLFDIVNMFSFYHYLDRSTYTEEIGDLLRGVNNTYIYKELQKFFIRKEFAFNKRSVVAILFYYCPVSIAFRLYRFLKQVRGFIYL